MKLTTPLRSAFVTRHSLLPLGIGLASTAAIAPGCSAPTPDDDSETPNGGDGDGDIDPDPDIDPDINPDIDIVTSNCESDCQDFPADPVFDPESSSPVSDADVAHFGSNIDDFVDGALCVAEPTLGVGDSPGALYPANWLRPRFRWTGGAGDSVYEIRLQAEEQANDLVAYTKNTSFAIPDEIWKKMAQNTHKPITVTIRGAGSGTISGMRGTIQIAPVNAGGTMVFWATNTKKVAKDASFLLSFS